jgi:hypothetical protein
MTTANEINMTAIVDTINNATAARRDEIFRGVDARNEALRAELLAAIDAIAKKQVAAAPAAPAPAAAAPAAPATTTTTTTTVVGQSGTTILRRTAQSLGMEGGVKPMPVALSRSEALQCIANGHASLELARIEEAGARALAVEAAFRNKVVVAPERGLTTWEALGLAAAGAALVGGAVGVTMYVTESGPFKPDALDEK